MFWLNNAQGNSFSEWSRLAVGPKLSAPRDDIMSAMYFSCTKVLEPGLAFRIMESVRKGKGAQSGNGNVDERKRLA